MSLFHDFRARTRKSEKVDFIVPERIAEARKVSGMTQEEAAYKLGISKQRLGLIENGHVSDIPIEFLFNLMSVYDMPKGFFYKVVWERV